MTCEQMRRKKTPQRAIHQLRNAGGWCSKCYARAKGIDALQRGGLKIKKIVLRRLQTAPKGTFINSDE